MPWPGRVPCPCPNGGQQGGQAAAWHLLQQQVLCKSLSTLMATIGDKDMVPDLARVLAEVVEVAAKGLDIAAYIGPPCMPRAADFRSPT